MNEQAVGAAIAKCGVSREELFITTKLWVQDASYKGAKWAIETSLDYLDMYLIHQPVRDYMGAWRAMEKAYQDGKLWTIGISNFHAARLLDFCESVEVKPTVDQVEIHPFFHQKETIKTISDHGVIPQAWGPLQKVNSVSSPILC